jgi:transposase-like protein
MSKSILTAPQFHDEAAALAYVEARIWPNGPTCPHCGNADVAKIGTLKGASTRPGVRKCYACRKPFSVKIGTIFESSHVPLHLWLQAIHLICASKKGMSSNQLHRILGITLKSAWFLSHRIRHAMKDNGTVPMGGAGEIVEVDETFFGRRKDKPVRRGTGHKHAVLTLVSRDGGSRSFHVENVSAKDVMPILRANIAKDTKIMTDEAGQYRFLKRDMPNSHEVVHHTSGEYARGETHTNTVEGFYSIFKRGMRGVYQHCSERHLHRYLAEFDFRYSARTALGVDDAMRADKALKGVVGKRLTYKAAGA